MLKYRYSKLRESMIGSWCPSMGAYGNLLPDRSGRNNHAVLTYDPPWQASPGGNKSGLAINFDGTGTYVEINGAVKNLTADATISTWFLNKGNFTGYQTLFDCGAAFNATTRQLSVFLGGNTSQLFIATKGTAGGFVSLSTVMAVDTWTHLAMSQAGATTSIYINGAFSGSTTSVSGSAFVEYPLRLAGNPTGGGAAFVGLQDSINIYNVALTPSEIATLGKYRGVEHEAYSVPIVRGAAVSGTTVTPSTASLTLTAFAPTVSTPQTVTPTTATLSLSAFAPTVQTPVTATPSTAALTLTAFAPTISTPQTVTPTTANVTLTAFAPTVTASGAVVVTPSTAALTLTTFAPDATAGNSVTVTPGTAVLTLTTYEPTVTATSGITVTPATATLTIATHEPTVTAGQSVTVTPGTASLILTTFAPSLGGNAPVWTITFVGNQACTGGLQVTTTTGDIQATETTGELAVNQLEIV